MIFTYMKNVPEDAFEDFIIRVDKFKEKYKMDDRKIKLTDEEILEILQLQDNIQVVHESCNLEKGAK